MAKFGSWGSTLTFAVSDESQLSFSNLTRKVGSRWATHKIVGGDTRAEYLGIDQGSITMDVMFSAEHGQRPYHDISKLNKACKTGSVNYLYIGGKRIGHCKWYIESISESWNEVWNLGELVRAKCKITFKEYH